MSSSLTTYRFLVAHDLARFDYDNFRRFEEEMQMVSSFIAPLTRRGRELVGRISQLDSARDIRVIQDKAFGGILAFEYARRIPIVREFKQQWDA